MNARLASKPQTANLSEPETRDEEKGTNAGAQELTSSTGLPLNIVRLQVEAGDQNAAKQQ